MKIYAKTIKEAGVIMAKLATKFGTQTTMYSTSNDYVVETVDEKNKTETMIINAYVNGLVEGMELQ